MHYAYKQHNGIDNHISVSHSHSYSHASGIQATKGVEGVNITWDEDVNGTVSIRQGKGFGHTRGVYVRAPEPDYNTYRLLYSPLPHVHTHFIWLKL